MISIDLIRPSLFEMAVASDATKASNKNTGMQNISKDRGSPGEACFNAPKQVDPLGDNSMRTAEVVDTGARGDFFSGTENRL